MRFSQIQEVYQVVPYKPICYWTTQDVDEWIRRRRPKLALKYALNFVRHSVTGRVLVEMTDNDLLDIGINSYEERQDILLEIRKEKLNSDVDELLQLVNNNASQ